MADFDDPMAALRAMRDEDEPGKKKPASKKKKRSRFDDPLQKSVSATDAAKATKSSKMVGQYAQRTFRVPPEYLELIRQIAAEEIMSIADAERWVIGQGLLAYYENRERPSFAKTVQRQVELPRWKE